MMGWYTFNSISMLSVRVKQRCVCSRACVLACMCVCVRVSVWWRWWWGAGAGGGWWGGGELHAHLWCPRSPPRPSVLILQQRKDENAESFCACVRALVNQMTIVMLGFHSTR